MNHSEISPQRAQEAVVSVTKDIYHRMLADRAGRPTLHEGLFGKIPEDYGDGHITFRQGHGYTVERLQGSERALHAQTMFYHQNFIIPETVTKENVESLLYNRAAATIALGRISITEPGIFKPVKNNFDRFYIRNEGYPESAGVGLAHVLNGSVVDKETHREYIKAIGESLRLEAEIRAEEGAYVDAVIGIILSKQV